MMITFGSRVISQMIGVGFRSCIARLAVDVAAAETWNGKLWKIEAFRQSWHVLATKRAQH
jgi:hypothetical protein